MCGGLNCDKICIASGALLANPLRFLATCLDLRILILVAVQSVYTNTVKKKKLRVIPYTSNNGLLEQLSLHTVFLQ